MAKKKFFQLNRPQMEARNPLKKTRKKKGSKAGMATATTRHTVYVQHVVIGCRPASMTHRGHWSRVVRAPSSSRSARGFSHRFGGGREACALLVAAEGTCMQPAGWRLQ